MATAGEGPARGGGALLSTVRGGCESSPALTGSVHRSPSMLAVSLLSRASGRWRSASASTAACWTSRRRRVACVRVSLASFSSQGGGGIDHCELSQRNSASTTPARSSHRSARVALGLQARGRGDRVPPARQVRGQVRV